MIIAPTHKASEQAKDAYAHAYELEIVRLKRELAKMHQHCAQKDEIIQAQQKIIHKEREDKAELLSREYWNDELHANPEITEIDKSVLYALMQYYRSVKKKDGYFYYSCEEVASRLGNRSNGESSKGNAYQAVKRVVRKLKEHGYIQLRSELQKSDKTRKNIFYKFSDTVVYYPKSIALGDHSAYGGNRVTIHSGCGGICTQEIVYNCTKCGECHITAKNVYHVTQEEHESRQHFEQSLPSMQEIEEQYVYVEACDIPDDIADEVGIQEVLAMDSKEIAEHIKTPLHIRQGLEDDEWEEIQKSTYIEQSGSNLNPFIIRNTVSPTSLLSEDPLEDLLDDIFPETRQSL